MSESFCCGGSELLLISYQHNEHDVERLKAVQVSRFKILLAVDLKESGARNIILSVMTTSPAFPDHFP